MRGLDKVSFAFDPFWGDATYALAPLWLFGLLTLGVTFGFVPTLERVFFSMLSKHWPNADRSMSDSLSERSENTCPACTDSMRLPDAVTKSSSVANCSWTGILHSLLVGLRLYLVGSMSIKSKYKQ